MTLEDLAECDAEVIEPIKYDFKHTHGPDTGVTLWEVRILATHHWIRVDRWTSVRPMVKG